ncbi:hypothetical protein H0W91_03160 [Patescibacteria group bacterium]|nr:hypothetical protein [Patescibacteria group bacterium]
MTKFQFKKGMALVEIIIGAAIMSVGIIAINASYSTYVQYALANQKNVEAAALMEEGLEVSTFFRDMGWVNISGLSTTTTYYLTFNGANWATTTTIQYVNGEFLRSINIADVNRDGNDDIATVGTLDPNTKKITTTVSYFQGHSTTTRSMSTYLTNI